LEDQEVTWLLVEDDSDIRNVVSVMMSVWGEKPLPFADGGAAWGWLDSVENGTYTGELPDLALMDIRMPGYTGDKVAARIRKVAAIKDIPIILMTAFSLTDTEIKEMMEQTGIDYLMNKPLPDMEVFRTTLYRVRDERKAKLAARASQTMPVVAPPSAASTTAGTPPPTPPVAPASTTPATPATPPAQPPTPAPAVPAQPTPSPTPAPATPPPTTPLGPVPTQPPTPVPTAPATPPAPAVPTQPTQPPTPAPTTPGTPPAPEVPNPIDKKE
jgi:CheY-like chemotaxis protein